jgi:hypothetical protein
VVGDPQSQGCRHHGHRGVDELEIAHGELGRPDHVRATFETALKTDDASKWDRLCSAAAGYW